MRRFRQSCGRASRSVWSIAYNTELVKNPPKTWMDLTKPEYDKKTGQVFAPSGGTTWTRIMFERQVLGEDYWAKQAATQSDPLSVGRADVGRDGARRSRDGRRCSTTRSTRNRRTARRSKIFFPPEGAPVNPYATGIPKTAANPNAAKLFLNWCLSKEGQAFMIKELGNLTSLKEPPFYPEGFDPEGRQGLVAEVRRVREAARGRGWRNGTRPSATASDRHAHEADEIMTATLDVTDLRKQFSIGRPAIDGVSFAVPAGEIVVLLGPSGCGKTTTLRCVAGLEHPTSGEISIAGRLVSSPERGILVPPRLRDLGMVFQSYAVWPHMTVRQNVVYPLKHRKIARADAGRKVDEVLELVGLSEYADRPVVALSGGQMQRVALARSIVYRPQLLLLDEPLSNLDAKLRLRLRDDLRVILKQTGMTALYVTHDQAEAVVLGDRIGVMRDGKLLQMGTPDQIYNRPADLFVANFTGATNELAGTLVGRNGEFGVVDFGDGPARRGGAAARARIRVTRCASRCGRKTSGSAGKMAATSFPPALSIAAIRAPRPSTTSICSAGDWRSLNSAPLPAIRSGSRPRFAAARRMLGVS